MPTLSLFRYIHIKDPLRYGRWMTKRVIYSSIGAIWLLAALISFLPVSLDLHKPQEEFIVDNQLLAESDESGSDLIGSQIAESGALYINTDDNSMETVLVVNPTMVDGSPQCALDLTPTYAIVSSCISFYLPCLVMLAIYSRLYFYARMHVQNIKAVTRPVIQLGRFEPDPNQPDSEVSAHSDTNKSPHTKRRHYHQPSANSQNNYHVSDHKAAITLGIIMGVFLICWVPFFCVNIVASFCKTCIPPIVFKILTWLGYSNSAFNPIIYSIFNLEFRLAFQKILTVKTRSFCCPHQDEYGQRSRGNSSGVAQAQGTHLFRMNHLGSSHQLQSNGHTSTAQYHGHVEETDRHLLTVTVTNPQSDQLSDARSSLLVTTAPGRIIAPAIKPHLKNISNTRQNSGQQLLVAEKVV